MTEPAASDRPDDRPPAQSDSQDLRGFPRWLRRERKPRLQSGLPEKEVFLRYDYYMRVSEVTRRFAIFYLLDIDRRKLYQSRGFTCTARFAAAMVGIPEKEAREDIRIGRALGRLPLIENAFARGEICWSKVRELTRVAVPETEEEWLALAKRSTSAELQRYVTGRKAGDRPGEGLDTPRTTYRLELTLSVDQHAAFDAALERILEGAKGGMTPAQAVRVMAETYLSLARDGKVEGMKAHGQPIYAVVYSRCKTCSATWYRDAEGEVPVPKEVVDQLEPSAKVLDAEPVRRPGEPAEAIRFGQRGSVPPEERDKPTPPALLQRLRAREGYRCAVCPSKDDLAGHHMESRANGGRTDIREEALLCKKHHGLGHDGKLKLLVNEERRVVGTDAEGNPLRVVDGPASRLDPNHDEFPLIEYEAPACEGSERAVDDPDGSSRLPKSLSDRISAGTIGAIPDEIPVETWHRIRAAVEWSPARRCFVRRPGVEIPLTPRPDDPSGSSGGDPDGSSPGAAPLPEPLPGAPACLAEFVGQRDLVQSVGIAIQAAKIQGKALGHVLLLGNAGTGKTTLAELIAREAATGMIATSAPVIETPAHLLGILADLHPRDILFIDEIHGLPAPCEEFLYNALLGKGVEVILAEGATTRSIRIAISPFTLIGATTDPDRLTEPFRSRFSLQEMLDPYSEKDLTLIVEQAAGRLTLAIAREAAADLARRSRERPREAMRLLARARDLATIRAAKRIDAALAREAAESLRIGEDGLAPADVRILDLLLSVHRALGIRTIAATLAMPVRVLETIHEPFLLRGGYVVRTARGRLATPKARARLDAIRRRGLPPAAASKG
ncbi:MAG: Holliday junction branch migration DNA helicase RuvB [Planctomycetes bacterium]|nr:Holliday junction branch migration DNA helicase RuvB [Planctomycetota bacterium]